jgi:hypothetical protein
VNIVRAALAAFVMLALAACYPPTTSHPIGTTTGLKLDPLLVGLWKASPPEPGERGAYYHFLPRLDGTITVLVVQTGNEPDGDWTHITLTTGTAGANHFMNAQLLGSDGKPDEGSPGGTVPVLYRVDKKGQISLYLTDETLTKAAITAGKIKGTIGTGEYGDAMITADPAELDRFMQSAQGLQLFAKPFAVLRKME